MKSEWTIQQLWSAKHSLMNKKILNEDEVTALTTLLTLLLGTHIPTLQEVKRAYECQELLRHCQNDHQRTCFLPMVEQYERKYTLLY
ncbi:hypothetical protein [Enterococcus sp. AZ126]|uniref:hypothetical protein n=1 Tax=Enterococcus sp. AZ126 TaxID=2774635 RepID=UPI003F244E2F